MYDMVVSYVGRRKVGLGLGIDFTYIHILCIYLPAVVFFGSLTKFVPRKSVCKTITWSYFKNFERAGARFDYYDYFVE